MRIQLDTIKGVRSILERIDKTITWTGNNNGTIKEHNWTRHIHETRGQTGIRIIGYCSELGKGVRVRNEVPESRKSYGCDNGECCDSELAGMSVAVTWVLWDVTHCHPGKKEAPQGATACTQKGF